MSKAIPDELDVPGFEAYVAGFSDELKELFGYLRSTAKNAGANVEDQRHKPKSGCGVRYYVRGENFCQLDPKIRENHVGIRLPRADRARVVADGFKPSVQPGWYWVKTMREAVRSVKWIMGEYNGCS